MVHEAGVVFIEVAFMNVGTDWSRMYQLWLRLWLSAFENVEQDLAHCTRFQVVELLTEKREQGILQLFLLLGVMKSSGWFLLGHVEAAGVVEAAEGALLGRCWLQ